VIPVVDGHPQTLCARYAPSDLDTAVELADQGRRALRDLLAAVDAVLADPAEWEQVAGPADVLLDIDTPLDLARLRARSC
jgi:molybdopterin-guanine dinucleotide biosynthesis protein A